MENDRLVDTDGPFLKMEDVSVQFPGVLALDGINFEMPTGHCRALMGKNGAGKSTLVRVLSGVQKHSGQLLIDGTPVTLGTPAQAHNAGIITVHQELTIVPGLSVAENVMLGRWPSRAGQLNFKSLTEEAQRALDLVGEQLDLKAEAGSLPIAAQQLIEIARAVVTSPRLLILDEPTSSLASKEVDSLLALVRRLVTKAVSVLYVSHRMNEIARVSDSVTVVRDGKIIDTIASGEASVSRVASLMVGDRFELQERSRQADDVPSEAPVLLEASHIAEGHAVADASVRVQAGEIVGIAGLLSSGRSELLQTLAGVRPKTAGIIRVKGFTVDKATPRTMLDLGIALVPEDRKGEGLVLSQTIKENLSMSSLPAFSRWGVIKTLKEKRQAKKLQSDLAIRAPGLDVLTSNLSGGNQQKVVLGRCLNTEADIYLLDEPTRGVDIQAKQQIYEIIRALAKDGNAVVLVSSEYEEILMLSHRTIVMIDGHTVGEVVTRDLDLETLFISIMEGIQ